MLRLNLGRNEEPEDEFERLQREINDLKDYSPSESDEEDDDMQIFKKKEKGKKKKKKKSDRYLEDKLELLLGDAPDNAEDVLIGDDILSSKKPKKGKLDIFDKKEARKKRKKNIEAKFAPVLTNQRKVLKDVEDTAAAAKELFDKMRGSTRYVGKNLVDLIQAINSSNSTRASILRDISNTNKAIIDLQLKETKSKKEESSDTGAEEFGAEFFSKIFSGGNRKEMKKYAADYYNSQEYDDDFTDEDEESFIRDRLESEPNKFRTSKGNKYIEYEHLRPEDCILYHRNGEWETGAIDMHGALMPDDYPLIPKENLGKVKFNLVDHRATDETGRTFKVVEVD